jgi:hypothetical protein
VVILLAARLLGALATAQEAAGIARVMHSLHADRIQTATRSRLAEPAYVAAWEEGRALPFEEAEADALAVASLAESGHEPAMPRPDPSA